MKFLLIIIFLVFGGGMLILSLLKGVSQLIFGKSNASASQSHYRRQNAGQNSDSDRRQPPRKIFGESEGEYVKYEEVKD